MKRRVPIQCEDWRMARAADVEGLYAEQCERWQRDLGWDFAPSCRIIEEARCAGRLPGLLARSPDGRVEGWCYFILHERSLQLGGLVAESGVVAGALLREVLTSADARRASRLTCFLFPAAPAVRHALARHLFVLEDHWYLTAGVASLRAVLSGAGAEPPSGLTFVGLLDVGLADLVRLMAAAYAGLPEARCFAPDGRLDQWAHYLRQLIATPACGRYLPQASLAVVGSDGRPLAALLMTTIASETAHLAQLVVDPGCRGQALGRRLMRAACDRLGALGYARVTLLVADANLRARRLYDQLGFESVSAFVYGERSVACTARAARARDAAA